MATEGAAEHTACSQCGKSIRAGATRCPHCQSPQARPALWRRPFAWVAAATTLLTLMFSSEQLYDTWSSGRELDRAVAEHVATARARVGSGRHLKLTIPFAYYGRTKILPAYTQLRGGGG